jgi:hypothetical protein
VLSSRRVSWAGLGVLHLRRSSLHLPSVDGSLVVVFTCKTSAVQFALGTAGTAGQSLVKGSHITVPR